MSSLSPGEALRAPVSVFAVLAFAVPQLCEVTQVLELRLCGNATFAVPQL
jgi:hypothetical protein